jgi:hypothetical protein
MRLFGDHLLGEELELGCWPRGKVIKDGPSKKCRFGLLRRSMDDAREPSGV